MGAEGQKSGEWERSGEWVWKNWLEREIAERGTEQEAGVTEIGLSDEQKFCHSRSAHMLWLWQVYSIKSCFF